MWYLVYNHTSPKTHLMSKLTYWASTLTLAGDIHIDTVKKFCDKFEKYYIVKEFGDSGLNPHYHTIIYGRYSRTTCLTTAIKNAIYAPINHPQLKSPTLVLTEPCSTTPYQYIQNYFLKDSLRETFFKGFDARRIDQITKRNIVYKMSVNWVKITRNQLCQLASEKIKEMGIDIPKCQREPAKFYEPILFELYNDGYDVFSHVIHDMSIYHKLHEGVIFLEKLSQYNSIPCPLNSNENVLTNEPHQLKNHMSISSIVEPTNFPLPVVNSPSLNITTVQCRLPPLRLRNRQQ